MKTTISTLSSLEHDILDWAIHSELFEDVEGAELSGRSSWDGTTVLTRGKLVIDWQAPRIAAYAELILQRLRGLSEGSNDKYAQVARNLEERLSHDIELHGVKDLEALAMKVRTATA